MEISKKALEKRKALCDAWLNGVGVEFVSEEAKSNYKQRVQRVLDAIDLKKPDRIPLMPFGAFMQTDLYNVSPAEAMYDYEKLVAAHEKYILEYEPDNYNSPAWATPGKVLDILGVHFYKYPRGGGLRETSSYQCVEKEYMEATDYDWLIRDPSDYWRRKFLPTICDSLKPLSTLSPYPYLWEIVNVAGHFIPYGMPEVKEMLNKMMEAGDEAIKWIETVMQFEMKIRGLGYPPNCCGAVKAPFDVLSDTMRGTRGLIADMFRMPDKIMKAIERITPIQIEQGVSSANTFQHPIVFIPLHKGADGFLSDEQFQKFYWPSLKALLLGLIEEGVIPLLFVEGGYNSRLNQIKDLPKGSCFWLFDRTDMVAAKKELGGHYCIGGNIPAGLLLTGTTQEVEEYTKKLIDDVGQDGGFIIAFGTVMDEGNPENTKALYDFTKKYGVY